MSPYLCGTLFIFNLFDFIIRVNYFYTAMKQKTKLRSLIFCLIILNLYSANLFAGKKKKLTVLNFPAKGVSGVYANTVRNKIEERIFETGRFRIYSLEQIRVILEKKNISISNASNVDAREIERIAGLDWVIVGSLKKDDRIKITVWLVDIQKKQTLLSENETVNSPKDIKATAAELSKRLIRKMLLILENKFDSASQQKNMLTFVDGYYMYPFSGFGRLVNSVMAFPLAFRKRMC